MWGEAYGDAVDEDDQAREEEHKQQEEKIPSHGYPVLDAESCCVGIRRESE